MLAGVLPLLKVSEAQAEKRKKCVEDIDCFVCGIWCGLGKGLGSVKGRLAGRA
jgi:hypothetical protein